MGTVTEDFEGPSERDEDLSKRIDLLAEQVDGIIEDAASSNTLFEELQHIHIELQNIAAVLRGEAP